MAADFLVKFSNVDFHENSSGGIRFFPRGQKEGHEVNSSFISALRPRLKTQGSVDGASTKNQASTSTFPKIPSHFHR
jgi:hypothetical protein